MREKSLYFHLFPWYTIERSWSKPNRVETIYLKHFIIEWLWWRWIYMKEVSYNEWKKLKV